MYVFKSVVATVAAGLWVGGLLGVTGCQTPPSPSPDERAERSARETQALYEAIVATYKARDLPIDLASEQYQLVRSTYQIIDDRLRQRFVAHVVELPGGASALRVRTDHQRRYGRGDEAVWKEVDSKLLDERAREAELELGRAIERRYRSSDRASGSSGDTS